jgi:hypothetical protein
VHSIVADRPHGATLVPARRSLAVFLLGTALFTAAFGGFLHTTVDGDMELHILYAQQLESIRNVTSPHFLFELALRAVHATGLPYYPAAALVLGLCYGAMALLIARQIAWRGAALTPFRAFVLIPALLIASHIFLMSFIPPRSSLYLGYFVPIAYHSATQQLNKLFGLWAFFIYVAQFIDAERPRGRQALALGGVSLLSALAKPSFLIAFLPATAIFSVRDVVRRRWRSLSWFAAAIVAPTVVVLLWQARLTYGGDASASVVFSPFEIFRPQPTLVKLPLSLAFPLVVAVSAWRSRSWNARLSFVWVFTAVAMFATLLLVEGGERRSHGNFAWTGQTGVFLAYVESVLFLLTSPVLPAWRRTAWTVFAGHVACGIGWYALVFTRYWHTFTGV